MGLWRRGERSGGRPGSDLLSRQEEAALVQRACCEADRHARDELVKRHAPLVQRLARYYARRGGSYPDLFQEGMLALLRSAERFEPARNVRFSTYAGFWVRAQMQQQLGRLLGFRFAAPAYVAYPQKGARLRARARDLRRTLSLDAALPARDGTPLVEELPAASRSPEEIVARQEALDEVCEALDEAVDDLGDPRVRLVVEERVLRQPPRSLEALGSQLHLSREGVRLLEKKVLRRVRELVEQQAA